jgi:predicted CoA-binding protein
MPSEYETFWELQRYAVVGHSAKRPFPRLTYGGLKDHGKTVFPVDPSAETIEGDRAYPDLSSLPEKVEAVVLELPREETREWVQRAIDHGVEDVWLHMGTDSPEAVSLAKEHGLRLRTGTCGVMYLRKGFTYHSIHRYINRWLGKY